MKRTLFLKLLMLLCFYAGNAQHTVETVTEVQNMIAFTTPPAIQSDVNRTHTLHYHYTLAERGILKISLSKYHRSGIPMLAIGTFLINPAMPTTVNPVQGSIDLFIPQGTVPSSQLINGQYYQWDAVLMTDSAILSSVTSPVTIGNALSVQSLEQHKLGVYPNPTSRLLNLPESFLHKQIKITDQTGRVVFNQMHNGVIDVSFLLAGVYQLMVDGFLAIKFVKQ